MRTQKFLAVAQNRTVQQNILPPGQLRVKTAAQLQKRNYTSLRPRNAGGRLVNAADDLQHGTLACTVAADQT